jgi:hypothetical protein
MLNCGRLRSALQSVYARENFHTHSSLFDCKSGERLKTSSIYAVQDECNVLKCYLYIPVIATFFPYLLLVQVKFSLARIAREVSMVSPW